MIILTIIVYSLYDNLNVFGHSTMLYVYID